MLHDSFEHLAPGNPGPSAWYREEDGLRTAVVSQTGEDRSLVVTNDPATERTTLCRSLPAWGSETITIRAELRTFGVGTADARLLTVKGPNGPLVAVRRSTKGMLGHLGPAGRVDDLPLAAGTPVTVTVTRPT